MEGRTAFTYVWLGTALMYLQWPQAGSPVHGDGYVLDNADRLAEGLESAGLGVSLLMYKARIEPLVNVWRAKPKRYKLTAEDAAALKSEMSHLRAGIEAEGGDLLLYVATSSRYPTAALMNDARTLIGVPVFNALTPIAQFDIEKGAQCLGLGLPTAGAFHLLRACEELLRGLYVAYGGTPGTRMLWKPMIDYLRAQNPRPPDVLLQHLDNIRLNFRNPTDHPEAIYTVDEVTNLFGLICDAIGRMVIALPTPTRAPTSP